MIVATRSEGKMRELVPLLEAAGYEPRSLSDVGIDEQADEAAIEAFDTFEENARAKAHYFSARAGGALVLAEDSGLEVHALGGAPGVRSKRWSMDAAAHRAAATHDAMPQQDATRAVPLSGAALDAANNEALLAALRGVQDRSARYVCVAVVVDGDQEYVARGEVAGHISDTARGNYGFGYDPFFESVELGMRFGEATAAQKAGVSHRGKAVRAVLALLASAAHEPS